MEKTFEEHIKSGGSGKKDRRNSGRGRYFKGSKGRRKSDRRRSFKGSRSRRGNKKSRGNKNRRDIEMTKVICDECGKECEVPFKPSSDKPVYCSDCFEKHDPKNNTKANKDLEIINAKLNKIMKALKIK